MDHEQASTDGEYRPSGIRWELDLSGGSPTVVIDAVADGQEIQAEFDPQDYAALSSQQHAWAANAAAWTEMYHDLIGLGMEPAVVRNLVFSKVHPLVLPARAVRALRVPRT